MRGIYCLSNDKVLDWVIALCQSLRVHEPLLPLIIIPFDERLDRLSRLAERYRFTILRDPSLERLDRIGALFYPDSPLDMHAFRKFAAFWGPFDQFVFLDSDIVALSALSEVMPACAGYDLVHLDFDMDRVYERGPFREEMVRVHGARGINTGAFVARRGVLTLDAVERLAADALAVKDNFVPLAEQPFMNYCLDKAGLRIAWLADIVPDVTGFVWALQTPIRRAHGIYRLHAAKRPPSAWPRMPLLHWAGYRCNWRIPNRAIHLRYRLGACQTARERLVYLWRFFEIERLSHAGGALHRLRRYLSRSPANSDPADDRRDTHSRNALAARRCRGPSGPRGDLMGLVTRAIGRAAKPLLLRAYGEWHYGRWLRWLHFTRLVPRLPCDLSRADILDAGCGTGNATLWLAARYPASHALGIDADAAEIAACRRAAAARGIANARFAVGRIEDIDDDRCFDLIYSIAVLEYIDRPAEAIARLRRALRPGGVLLFEVRDRDIGASATFGLRRHTRGDHDLPGAVRRGYALSELHRLLEGSGLRVRGARYAIAPLAALAHTVFERLRKGRLRWYFALLPLLRAVGYTDFLLPWRRGGSLMMWAQRDDA